MTKTKMGRKQHDGCVTLILDSGKYNSSASKEDHLRLREETY